MLLVSIIPYWYNQSTNQIQLLYNVFSQWGRAAAATGEGLDQNQIKMACKWSVRHHTFLYFRTPHCTLTALSMVELISQYIPVHLFPPIVLVMDVSVYVWLILWRGSVELNIMDNNDFYWLGFYLSEQPPSVTVFKSKWKEILYIDIHTSNRLCMHKLILDFNQRYTQLILYVILCVWTCSQNGEGDEKNVEYAFIFPFIVILPGSSHRHFHKSLNQSSCHVKIPENTMRFYYVLLNHSLYNTDKLYNVMKVCVFIRWCMYVV